MNSISNNLKVKNIVSFAERQWNEETIIKITESSCMQIRYLLCVRKWFTSFLIEKYFETDVGLHRDDSFWRWKKKTR